MRVTGQRPRVDVMSAVASRGALWFTVFTERFTAPVLTTFLDRVAGQAGRKVHVVARHPVHNGLLALADVGYTGAGASPLHVDSRAHNRLLRGIRVCGEPRNNAWHSMAGVVVDAEPRVGAQLSRERWRPALPEICESTGRLLDVLGVAGQWSRFDPERYPFVHKVAARLREHDDREQFLAGVDVFRAGIATLR